MMSIVEAISVNRFLNDFFHRISFNHKKYRSLFSIWNWYGQSCKIYRTISFLWKNNYALTTFHQRYLCSFNQSFHWHVHFHSLKFEREKPRIRRQSFVYASMDIICHVCSGDLVELETKEILLFHQTRDY